MSAAFATDSTGLLTLVPTLEPDPDRAPLLSRPWVEPTLLAVPLVLVNLFAAFGQSLWAWDNLTKDMPGPARVVISVGFSIAVETVALVLSAIAHRARMAGDASLPARLASYGVAGGAAFANYSHWSPDWAPTAAACTFAAFSFGSPWLWGIWSKSKHRAALRESGQIDPRSVRFSLARWLLWFGPTFRAYRLAVWEGTTDPAAAVNRWETIGQDVTDTTPETRGAGETEAPTTAEPVQPPVADRASTPEAALRRAPRGQAPRRIGTPTSRRIAEHLKTHPKATQQEIADAVGVSKKTVQRILSQATA